jgi:hypothetical protein
VSILENDANDHSVKECPEIRSDVNEGVVVSESDVSQDKAGSTCARSWEVDEDVLQSEGE